MRFKMIISRAMFVFSGIKKGKAQLESVHFISDEMMDARGNLMVVKRDGQVDFFIPGTEPLGRISSDQIMCLSAAARFFGPLPGSNSPLSMWLGAGTMVMEPQAESLPIAA
ncbi:MAG: hypothetical protein CSB34_04965 [Desulfobulbus propionicus]|nr:MAG: hypothetical protein CSB34_04965 [Desulfobulbus propionicus]